MHTSAQEVVTTHNSCKRQHSWFETIKSTSGTENVLNIPLLCLNYMSKVIYVIYSWTCKRGHHLLTWPTGKYKAALHVSESHLNHKCCYQSDQHHIYHFQGHVDVLLLSFVNWVLLHEISFILNDWNAYVCTEHIK